MENIKVRGRKYCKIWIQIDCVKMTIDKWRNEYYCPNSHSSINVEHLWRISAIPGCAHFRQNVSFYQAFILSIENHELWYPHCMDKPMPGGDTFIFGYPGKFKLEQAMEYRIWVVETSFPKRNKLQKKIKTALFWRFFGDPKSSENNY